MTLRFGFFRWYFTVTIQTMTAEKREMWERAEYTFREMGRRGVWHGKLDYITPLDTVIRANRLARRR